MTTITIPKSFTQGKELVIIPREEYEAFFEWQKTFKIVKEFTPTKKEKKDLENARKNYKKGNYLTLYELKQKLGIKS